MKSPAFQFYPDKWQTDTRRLSWEAKGVYWELCSVIWIQNQQVILDNQMVCAIPEDDQFIASEVGCDATIWERCKAEIMHPLRPLLDRFSDGKTNWLISNGLTKELIKQQERRGKMAANGKLGGRPKKQLLSTPQAEKQKVILEKAEKSSLSPSLSPSLTKEEVESDVLGKLRQKLNALYKRSEHDRWSYAEESELVEVCKRECAIEEYEHILRYRQSMQPDDRRRFFPQKLSSLLLDWTGTLDKARVQCPIKKAVQFPIKKALEEKAISIDDLKASLEWTKANTPDAKETIATLERRIKEMSK